MPKSQKRGGRSKSDGPAPRKRQRGGVAAASAGASDGKLPRCEVDATDALQFLDFVDQSPSPFHAVATVVSQLEESGFTRLREKTAWKLKPGKKYFLTRNQSTVFAFVVGGKWKPGNGFSIVAAHTDSPCLRIKPNSSNIKTGYLSVGVELYGGGLWHTWFDRDLSVAGRVVTKDDDGNLEAELVKIDRPLMRIPTLAIHLNREVNKKGFQFNMETQLAPILATEVKAQLGGGSTSSASGGAGGGAGAGAAASSSTSDGYAPKGSGAADGRHHDLLIQELARELSCDPDQIVDFELCLYDTQRSAIGGPRREFVYAPRLDNLLMSFCGLEGLLASSNVAEDVAADTNVRLLALFDNEEVGSGSMMGAGSNMMAEILTRISGSLAGAGLAVKKSLLVSADMAHAVHPNYATVHEEKHRPMLHQGMVIKHNAKQRYATSSLSAVLLREIAIEAGVPVQEFVVRQDSLCGSTIGPMLSASTGMRTVDVGLPQLSMHSIREMCGTDDISYGIQLFTHFYNAFPSFDERLSTGE